MYDLEKFTLSQMIECGASLRTLNENTRSMEEAANQIVEYLYKHLFDTQHDRSACALVRFYKTHPFGELDPELCTFARSILGQEPPSSDMKCLCLLGTVGEQKEWNERLGSTSHQAIPLPSEQGIAQLPMIAQLVKQFGIEINTVLQANKALLVDRAEETYNVFYVPDAVDSPYIPAQKEFVIPYGIKSVVGFGGMFPTGDLFAVIIFSRVPIPRETADLFKTLSLNVKISLLPFINGPIFA